MIETIFKRVVLSLFLVTALVVVTVITPTGLYRYFFDNNFQAVIPGVLFRSAQPDPDDLVRWVAEHGIKTVISLRGHNPNKDWYQTETAVAEELGIQHADVRMHSDRLPPAHILRQLVNLLKSAEKPVLVHCKGGVHRSGLAAGATLLLNGGNLHDAERQFSVSKGFFSWFDESEVPQVFTQYRIWLGEERHSLEAFQRWVEQHYVAYFYSAEITSATESISVAAKETFEVNVQVLNTSPQNITLRAGDGLGVRLGARVYPRAAEHFIPGDNNWLGQSRTANVNKVLKPGESIALTIPGPIITRPGEYDLVIDLVDEHVTWFENMGSNVLVIPVAVSAND